MEWEGVRQCEGEMKIKKKEEEKGGHGEGAEREERV